MPRMSNAKFRVRAVCRDAIEPGGEGRVASKRLDPPDNCPEGVLDDLLGIRAAARDAHRQAVDAISVPSNQRLDGAILLPAQRFHEIFVAIRAPSKVSERQLSHVTPSLAEWCCLFLGCIGPPSPDRRQHR